MKLWDDYLQALEAWFLDRTEENWKESERLFKVWSDSDEAT